MEIEKLQRLKNGNHQVFREMYEENYRKVFQYFILKAKNESVAQDLTQQTFIKLWVYRGSVDVNLTIDQQLFRKAKQVFIDWLRTQAVYRKRFEKNINFAENKEEALFVNPAPENELKFTLKVAIESLPEKRKRVFELKHIEGLSYKEIAEMLGISVKTVDNQLMKATAHLRKFFLFVFLFLFF